MSDDPFAEPTDSDRTMIRPRPGGARPAMAPPPAAAPAPAPSAGQDSRVVPTTGSNKLLADGLGLSCLHGLGYKPHSRRQCLRQLNRRAGQRIF